MKCCHDPQCTWSWNSCGCDCLTCRPTANLKRLGVPPQFHGLVIPMSQVDVRRGIATWASAGVDLNELGELDYGERICRVFGFVAFGGEVAQ